MLNRLVLTAVLLACALALRAETFYRIELAPTGYLVTKDAPVWKGTTLVFRRYPDGTVMSVRKSDVKTISQLSQAAQALSTSNQVVQIGNLAMQGGSTQAGPTNASAVGARRAPAIGGGFYGNVVPGVTQGMPNSANDNQIGRTWAAPPANAVQSSPGAPPTMPQ
jgi:hypothetical protein